MTEALAIAEPGFVVFGKPDIGQAEKDAVLEVLDSGWLSTGPRVQAFEEAFRKHLGDGFPVAVSSCTDGLILALIASGVGPGDEVITSPLTFAATVNAIFAVGARPVFADVTPSGHIDPKQIEAVITTQTRAVIPIHYTGSTCDISEIKRIAEAHLLTVIEDAAHAFGGTYGAKGKPIGTAGDFACFSFYPTKNITSGEGGMVVCKDEQSATLVRALSLQGLSAGAHERYSKAKVKTYHVIAPGRKANMSDIHAAIGLAQLERWPVMKSRRSDVWDVYERAFGKKEAGHSQHLYTVQDKNRTELRRFLYKQGVGTGIHFHPLHLEPGYKSLGYEMNDFPMAETIGLNTLSLPVSATMSVSDALYVVDQVEAFRKNRETHGRNDGE